MFSIWESDNQNLRKYDTNHWKHARKRFERATGPSNISVERLGIFGCSIHHETKFYKNRKVANG